MKKGTAPELRTVEPAGDITDARTPIAVTVALNWRTPFNTDADIIQPGWALAWTRNAVLVAWRDGPVGQAAWMATEHVKYRLDQ
jgi:hypothetical protein